MCLCSSSSGPAFLEPLGSGPLPLPLPPSWPGSATSMGNGVLRARVCRAPVPCGLASLWLPCQGDKGSWDQRCAVTGGSGCYPGLQLGSLRPGRSGCKFTEQATHTAHQGCWTVPRARAGLALGPNSEDSTIWLPLGAKRRKGSEPGEERATLPAGCWEPSLGRGRAG